MITPAALQRLWISLENALRTVPQRHIHNYILRVLKVVKVRKRRKGRRA
jgi:hypothetical protein